MKSKMRPSPLKFKVRVKTASGETKSLKEVAAAKNATKTSKAPAAPAPTMQMKKYKK